MLQKKELDSRTLVVFNAMTGDRRSVNRNLDRIINEDLLKVTVFFVTVLTTWLIF